jgi:hypothetical protein
MNSLCGICGGRSCSGTRFLLETSNFPCQYHFTGDTRSFIQRRYKFSTTDIVVKWHFKEDESRIDFVIVLRFDGDD